LSGSSLAGLVEELYVCYAVIQVSARREYFVLMNSKEYEIYFYLYLNSYFYYKTKEFFRLTGIM